MITNVEEIKEKADLLRVVEHYLIVQKSQGLFKALCPFHSEKTPSFMINTKKNMFYCFGCNEGGDVFAFVKKLKHLSFAEAVEEVANICGLVCKHEASKQQVSRKELYALLESVNAFLQKQLLSSEEALKELKERGLSVEDALKFDLGLWSNTPLLLKQLSEAGDLEKAVNLGVFYKSKHGGYFCPFENRLNFSVRNEAHKVVGFSARYRGKFDLKVSKYLNSKESELYKKSFLLYNFSRAKTSILKEKAVIICEGITDCLALVKFGFTHSVATCGTALTLSHISALYRLNAELNFILSFDKDNAGENANLKALALLFKQGIFNVTVRVIKAKVKDYGDLLKKGFSSENISECLHDYGGFEYYVKMHLLRIENNSFKLNAFFSEVKELIASQANFFLKEELITQASEFFNCEKSKFYTQETLVKEKSFHLERSLLKTIISDESAAFLAKEYLRQWHFKDYGQAFASFINTGKLDNTLLALSVDESVKVLRKEEFSQCVKALVKEHLNAELEQAKRSKNITLIVELAEQLKTLA